MPAADALRPAGHPPQARLVRDEAGDRWAWPQAGPPAPTWSSPRPANTPNTSPRDVLHGRLPPGRPAGRESDDRGDRRTPLPGLSALRPGRRRGRRDDAPPPRVLLPGAWHPPARREAPQGGKRPAGPKPAACSRRQPPDEIVNLLTAAFCNYILGNGDAHGKNFALIDRERTALGAGGELAAGAAHRPHLDRRLRRPDPPRPGDLRGGPGNVLPARTGRSLRRMRVRLRSPARPGVDHRDPGRQAVETIATRAKKEGWHQPIVDKSSNSPPTAPSAWAPRSSTRQGVVSCVGSLGNRFLMVHPQRAGPTARVL